jgi:hypothetical protein
MKPHFIPKRNRPFYYVMEHLFGGNPLAIVGHYETACGGCDTITDVSDAFAAVRLLHELEGLDVIFEGLLIAADVNRTVELHRAGIDLHVLALTTPLDLCVASVNQRRWAKNPEKPPVNPKNTASKYRGVELSIPRLRAAKVPVYELCRETAFEKACELLNLNDDLL